MFILSSHHFAGAGLRGSGGAKLGRAARARGAGTMAGTESANGWSTWTSGKRIHRPGEFTAANPRVRGFVPAAVTSVNHEVRRPHEHACVQSLAVDLLNRDGLKSRGSCSFPTATTEIHGSEGFATELLQPKERPPTPWASSHGGSLSLKTDPTVGRGEEQAEALITRAPPPLRAGMRMVV